MYLFNKNHILITYLVLLTVFFENIFLPINVGFDFRLQFVFILLLFPVLFYLNQNKINISRSIISILILYFILSVFTSMNFGINGLIATLKQFVLICIWLIFISLTLNYIDFNFNSMLKIYLKIVFVFAIVGIVQYLSLYLEFKPGYDFSYLGFNMDRINFDFKRTQSWAEEPFFFVLYTIPALFISLGKILKFKLNIITNKQAWTIIICFLLTFSTMGFIAFVICIILLINIVAKNFLKYFFIVLGSGMIILFVLIIILYNNNNIKMRIDDTYAVFKDDKVLSTNLPNISSYAIYSNTIITKNALKTRPFFGYGIGNYENVYKQFYNKIPYNHYKKINFLVNNKDAASLLLRLLTETGLLGTLFFLFLIIKNKIKYNYLYEKDILNLWFFNNGIFVLILIKLLRNGHYSAEGFFMFLMFYFLTNQQIKNRKIGFIS